MNYIDPLGLEYRIIGSRPGGNGQYVPIVYDTVTKKTTIGFPETNYVDPISAALKDIAKDAGWTSAVAVT